MLTNMGNEMTFPFFLFTCKKNRRSQPFSLSPYLEVNSLSLANLFISIHKKARKHVGSIRSKKPKHWETVGDAVQKYGHVVCSGVSLLGSSLILSAIAIHAAMFS